MSIDPYDDYLNKSRKKLAALRRIAARRRKKFGHKRAWTKGRGARAKGLKARLARNEHPLGMRNRQEVVMQATGLMNRAYQPVEADFTAREARARSVAGKRKQDELYFAQWQNTQQASMRAQAAAGDAALLTRQREIQAAATTRTAAAPGEVEAAVEGQAGVVSDVAGGSAIAGVRSARTHSEDQLSAQQTRTLAQLGEHSTQRKYLDATVTLNQRADQARVASEMYKELATIADGRNQAKIEKAGKLSGEIARLLDQEVSKAQADREIQLAAGKLGVQEQAAKQKAKVDKQKYKLASKKYAQSLRKDKLDAAIKRANLRLKSKDLSRKERDSIERGRHNLATEQNARAKKKAGPGKKGSKPTEGARNKFARLDNGVRKARAWSKGKYNTQHKLRQRLQKDGYNRLERDAIAQLLFNKKLSRGTYNSLKNAGVHIPKSWRT